MRMRYIEYRSARDRVGPRANTSLLEVNAFCGVSALTRTNYYSGYFHVLSYRRPTSNRIPFHIKQPQLCFELTEATAAQISLLHLWHAPGNALLVSHRYNLEVPTEV